MAIVLGAINHGNIDPLPKRDRRKEGKEAGHETRRGIENGRKSQRS